MAKDHIACHRVAFPVPTVIEHSIKHHIFKFVICAWYQPEKCNPAFQTYGHPRAMLINAFFRALAQI